MNKVGVWSAAERPDWFADGARQSCTGGNGQRTAHRTRDRRDQPGRITRRARCNLEPLGKPLLPIGVLYDPFVERALEPWSFGIYSGGQSILVGTPSGVSLAPEGGAHQSIKTPYIGLESQDASATNPLSPSMPSGACWPASARLGKPAGRGLPAVSTRPVDQAWPGAGRPGGPGASPSPGRRGRVRPEAHPAPEVTLAAMGALVPEALTAATRLDELVFPQTSSV